MTTWYSKELGDGIDALAPSLEISKAYVEFIALHGDQTGAAVYARNDREQNIKTMFFTPQAEGLAKAFGATPCPTPSSQGLILHVGSARDRTIHFGD